MSKHTKGPWHVVLSDNATPFIQHECGHDWTDIDDRSSRICHMPAEIMENFNSLNNARLIAAAPELLEALEGMLQIYGVTEANLRGDSMTSASEVECCNIARAAIAKARGEA